MTKQNKNGNSILLIAILALIVLVAVGLLLSSQNQTIPQQTASVPAIQNTSDLDRASKDLDNANLNQIDTTQSQINADSSNF